MMLPALSWGMSLDEEKKYDELEGLAFIKALIMDKKYEEVIRQYPSVAKNKEKLGHFHYYLALAQFNVKKYSDSFETLKIGNRYKVPKKAFYQLWGRTSSKLKKYEDCTTYFEKSEVKYITGLDWVTYGECARKEKKSDKIIQLALNLKITDMDFFLVGQEFLINHGLHTFAKAKREKFFSICQDKMLYLKAWALYEKLKVKDGYVLEAGHRCHPKNLEITGALVKLLFAEGKYHSVAYIFDELSKEDPMFYKHAAEFYKVAGRNSVGEYFNILGDEAVFVLAKSSKFLNEENYAGLLTIPFKPESLKENKDLAYAIAYSQFKYLSLNDSKKTLMAQHKKSTKDDQLLNLIEKCRELDWKCRP